MGRTLAWLVQILVIARKLASNGASMLVYQPPAYLPCKRTRMLLASSALISAHAMSSQWLNTSMPSRVEVLFDLMPVSGCPIQQ